MESLVEGFLEAMQEFFDSPFSFLQDTILGVKVYWIIIIGIIIGVVKGIMINTAKAAEQKRINEIEQLNAEDPDADNPDYYLGLKRK